MLNKYGDYALATLNFNHRFTISIINNMREPVSPSKHYKYLNTLHKGQPAVYRSQEPSHVYAPL